MTDTHTHLYLFDSYEQGRDALKKAIDEGVDRLIFPAVDSASIDAMLKMQGEFPNNTSIAYGLHPTSVNVEWRSELTSIVNKIKESESLPIAIGEVGIDLYWDKSFRDQQIEAFSFQTEMAKEAALPMIIHCREGLEETLDVIKNENSGLNCVFHSFTGSKNDVETIRKVGDYYFGINGVVTYKNAETLRDALPIIGLDRILLETDSPYLAPVPFRGKRNESAYIVHVAKKIADVLHVSFEDVVETTNRNASAFFKI